MSSDVTLGPKGFLVIPVIVGLPLIISQSLFLKKNVEYTKILGQEVLPEISWSRSRTLHQQNSKKLYYQAWLQLCCWNVLPIFWKVFGCFVGEPFLVLYRMLISFSAFDSSSQNLHFFAIPNLLRCSFSFQWSEQNSC